MFFLAAAGSTFILSDEKALGRLLFHQLLL
jgi:hypothetical protein